MEPLNFDPEALDRKIEQQQEDREITMADQDQLEQQQQLSEEAGKNDPPNALQEAGTAIVGGLAQSASDIVTLPALETAVICGSAYRSIKQLTSL